MQRLSLKTLNSLLLIGFCCFFSSLTNRALGKTTANTISTVWTVPTGVTCITIEYWGGGLGGSAETNGTLYSMMRKGGNGAQGIVNGNFNFGGGAGGSTSDGRNAVEAVSPNAPVVGASGSSPSGSGGTGQKIAGIDAVASNYGNLIEGGARGLRNSFKSSSVTAGKTGALGEVRITTCTPSTAPTSVSAGVTTTPLCAGSTINLQGTDTGATSWTWVEPNNFGSSLEDPTLTSATTAATGTYFLTPLSGCGPAIGWANISSPTTGTVCTAGNFDIYGQIFASGVTEAPGQGTGVTASLGWSTTNSNPSTWTNWNSAVFNSQQGNNDQFYAQLTGLAAGTYYYAFRYSINGCPFTYGGTGGVWSTNSGILTVNDCFGIFASAPNLTSCNTTVAAQGTFYNTSGSGSNLINANGVNYQSYNYGTYFQNSAGLLLKGAELKTFKSNTGNVCSAKMYYRVYSGAPSGAFTAVNLTFFDGCSSGAFPTGGPCNVGDQKWRDISQSINLTSYVPGTYSLEIYYELIGSHVSTSTCEITQYLNNNGSNYIANFTIISALTASNTGPYCEGVGTVTLGASNGSGSYAWSGPSSFSAATQNPANGSPIVASAGVYTVTATNTGCISTATTTVVVNTVPSISNKTGTICSGGTHTLATASPDFVPSGTTYSWTFIANSSITGASTGTAQSSFSQTLTNTSSLPQVIIYTITPTIGTCAGATFTVTITVDAALAGGTVSNNQTICSGTTPALITNTTLPSGGNGLGLANSTQIGTQIWMNRNLDIVNYNDGTAVGTVFNTVAGAYAWYNDDYPTWGQYYGALYNWHAVNTGKLCPSGWHVPTETEWNTLITLASGSTTAGKKLKSCRTIDFGCATTLDPTWDGNSTAFGTDDYVFTALPAGRVYWNTGAKVFERIRKRTRLWSSTLNDASNAKAFEMNWNTSDIIINNNPYSDGYSVRCMGDNATTIQNSYTYQWQQDSGCTGSWTNISGATAPTYQPSALIQTTCFRRVVTDACGIANSNTITITVNASPAITNMTTTICSGTLFSAAPVNGTNGTVPTGTTYTWTGPVLSPGLSITGGSAQAVGQSSITQTLTNTTTATATATYTVTPTSGTCAGTTFTVTVTVLPGLSSGMVSGVSHLVISQVYGGGGNSGATYTNDFVELYNPTGSTVSLNGWSLQYASSTSTTWGNINLVGVIQPGGYFLVQMFSAALNGSALPTANQTSTINMSVSAGKIALVNSITSLTLACPVSTTIIDFVGFGAANCSEGSVTTPHSNSTWLTRKLNGCQDTDVNSVDFIVTNTQVPRNSASPINICSNATISAVYSETVCAGQNASSMTVSGVSGGNGTFTYQWYSRLGTITCPTGSSTAGWSLIAGATSVTYTPTTVNATTTFASFVTFTGANSCGGAWSTNCRTVTVNPAPIISNMTATICSGTAFAATPVNGTNGTVPNPTTYSWAAPSVVGITGSALGSVSLTVTGTLTNTTSSPLNVVYTITPLSGSCSGGTYTLTVTVNPNASVINMNVSVCTGVPIIITPTNVINGNIPSGTTFTWGAPAQTGVSGGASGSGSSISATLTGTGTAVYTVTPSLGSCPSNPFTVSINVDACLPMTACNLVVYKIGNGSVFSSNAFPVTLDEISPTGSLIQNISLPFSGANLMTQNGTATSVGKLNSYNGFLSIPGFNTAVGNPLTNGASADAGILNKVNTIIDASVAVQSYTPFPTSAPIPFINDNHRGSVPITATTFYVVGKSHNSAINQGLFYFNGTNFSSQLIAANLRGIEIFNNQLYVSNSVNIYATGTGIPATISSTTLPTGLLPTYPSGTASIYGFSISPDGCTMYVADNGTSAYRGISKWKKISGTWTYQHTYSCFAFDLTVDYSGSNNRIYATMNNNGNVSPSDKVIRLIDSGTAPFTLDWTYSAPSNYRFAGIDFTPNSVATIANINNVNPQGFTTCQNGTSQTLTVASAISSNTLSYQWYSNSTSDLCGGIAIPAAVASTYTPPVATVGTVYYFVKISSSCASTNYSSIAAVIVNQTPTVSLNCNLACSGVAEQLSATPAPTGTYTYLWSPSTGLSSTTINNPTATISSNTTYSVVVTNTSTNCQSVATNCALTISQAPSVIFVSPP